MLRSFALSLAALTVPLFAGAQPPANPNPLAATVNGETIALADVDALLKHTLPDTPLNATQQRRMRLEVLSDMIDDVLVRQFLRKNGPKVDPAEIDAQLKAFGEKLKMEGKTLADFYKKTGQTEAQVREAWITEMQLTGYVKSIVTKEQLRAYFNANKDYFDQVQVKVRQIVLRVNKNTPPAERTAAKERLETIRAAIAAGQLDFATAAKKYSQCPTASTGGELGYIFRKGGLADESVAKAAFALKMGELSGIVETEFGIHILQVTDRKAGTPSKFEDCVTEVLDAYSDDFRTELTAKLRKQAQIQITVP